MKIRILASIVLLLGGLYLSAGITAVLEYRSVSQTFAYYGMSDILMTAPELAHERNRLIAGAIEFPLIGVLVLGLGVGLRLAKSWARNMWLGMVIVLTVFHLVRLFQDYQLSTSIVSIRIVEVLFIGSLALISWLWLPSRSSHDGRAQESRAR
jgi:dolichyl-phosphate-mannose--protein O-mannosyl transferase